MNSMMLVFTLLTLGGAGAQPAAGGALKDAVTSVSHVEFIDDIELSAQEAGRIEWVEFQEGDEVKKGETIAQLDDFQVKARRDAVLQEARAAETKSKNNVNIRYAEATIDVSQAAYDMAIAANDERSRAIPRAEINKRWHELQRARLSKEQAILDSTIDDITHQGKKAELEAAEDMIARRKIVSPVDGMIQQVFHDAGEWVNPGDPIARVVRMDKLRVKGLVSALEYSRTELARRPVTIEVEIARGGHVHKETFQGKVTFADPEIQSQNEYWISAEVNNRQVENEWLLQPGLAAVMTIHINPAGAASRESAEEPMQAKTPINRAR